MDVRLTRELENFVQRLVDSGRYGSASEVVGEALRLMAEREASAEGLRRKIDLGLDSLKRGEGVDGEAFFAQLEREEAARR